MKTFIGVHSTERASERGVTPKQIDSLLADKRTIIRASKRDESAMLAFGFVNDKLWAVVVNWQTGRIITVRRASKKERRSYDEVQRN